MLSFSRLQSSSNANTKRRKVLIAAPFPPRRDGFHGGSLVIGRLVDELAESHSVAVAYLRAETELPMEEALARRCEVVEEVPRPGAPRDASRLLRLLGAWVRGYPMWVEDWHLRAFQHRLRELVERWQPGVVQFEFHVMAQYADAAKGCASILVEHEPGAAAARDRWQFSEGWRRPVLARDMRSWIQYERRHLGKFDAVVCFTELDRRELLELAPSTRIEVIPPCGSPMRTPQSRGSSEAACTILFVGNFIHPPNVDAAKWLAGQIFPRVRARHPEAVLQLVGDSPPASIRGITGPRVVITGRVPDVSPFLDAATVVVAPLRIGGGIRIKMMDALTLGKAIVATPRAVEGLNVDDGREMLLAESDEAFADAVSTLLSDSALRDRLSANARAWAVQFLAPGRVGAAFEELYGSLDRSTSPANRMRS